MAWLVILGIYAIAALGLHILTGLCGLFSMGHAAFMAVGAYTTAILGSRYGLSPWATLPLAGLLAALAGLVFAMPALRIKGFFLVMASIAALFVVNWVISEPLEPWTGGVRGTGVPAIEVGGKMLSDVSFWWLTLGLLVLTIIAAKNIQRTATGRRFIAVRDNDLAAEVMGINLFRTKLLAFFIGSFFAGIAGWLWAHYFLYITPLQFDFRLSLWFVGMLIVGGLGSTTGAISGVVLLRLSDKMVDYVSDTLSSAFPNLGANVFPALSLMVFALIVIIFIMIEPRGLYHRFESLKLYYRLHPFSY